MATSTLSNIKHTLTLVPVAGRGVAAGLRLPPRVLREHGGAVEGPGRAAHLRAQQRVPAHRLRQVVRNVTIVLVRLQYSTEQLYY